MTIFEKIVKGEIPSHKIWEDDEFLSFLDIQPVARGHSLIIPKEAVDPATSMEPQKFQRFWGAAHEVAKILESEIPCQRVCMAVVGFEVPHAHIHLIPAQSMSDFPWPGGKPSDPNELKALAASLLQRSESAKH